MAPRKRPNVNSENQECNMSKKKTRGASLLKDLTKSIGNGIRLSVEFKRNGQVIGENRAKLSSYIGTVVKKWVPITIDDWRLVSQEQRDNIWQNVLHAFILPDNRKKWVLKKANILWGTFKKDLGRLHMRDEETNELITEPPAIYDSYITQDQWTEFIRNRESKEFKVKSQKYRELAKQNKNSYRASRKGYHWVLILMIPHMSSAYWIDPRHGKVDKDAELLVAMSYKLKYAKMNKRTPRKQVLWHAIKCPLQQNMFDCGYYVLLFMRKVVFSQKQSSTIPSKWYDDKTTYKHHDVDEMRREWLDYFISLI